MAGFWEKRLAVLATRGEDATREYWMHDCTVLDCPKSGCFHPADDFEHWYCLPHFNELKDSLPRQRRKEPSATDLAKLAKWAAAGVVTPGEQGEGEGE